MSAATAPRHRAPRRRPTLRRSRLLRPALAVAVAAATTVVVVAASEAFMTSGAGAGTGRGAAALTVGLSPATGGADLRPGDRGTVHVEVVNPTTEAVLVDRLAVDPAYGAGAVVTDAAACPGSLLSFAPQTNDGAGWRIPAREDGRDGTRTLRLAGSLLLSASAPDACQGVRVTVHLSTEG